MHSVPSMNSGGKTIRWKILIIIYFKKMLNLFLCNVISVMGDLEFLQLALLPSYGDFVWNEWDRALHQQQQQQMNSNNNNNNSSNGNNNNNYY
jgi:hypothetical protein